MRVLILLGLAGCSTVLGISDPTPATSSDGGVVDGTMIDSIDAPPPCAPPLKLAAEMVSELGKAGSGFAIGKLDNGAAYDVAVATGTDVRILHGDAAGAFGGDGLEIVVPTAATDVVSADFDDDGDDDLAMWTSGGTSVIVRRTNRALSPPVEEPQPLTGSFTSVRRVLVQHLDGAFRPDLLVYDSGAGTRAYTSNALTLGTFSRNMQLAGTGADELILMTQIDDAQRPDAVFKKGGLVEMSRLSTVTVFGALEVITNEATSAGIAVGNFDGDQRADLVVSTAQGLVLFRQSAATAGTFTRHGVISPVPSATPMLVGDVNGDGRDDIVTPTAAILQCAAPGGEAGVFTQVEPLAAQLPAQLFDVTGDGKLDLVRVDGASVKVRVQQ